MPGWTPGPHPDCTGPQTGPQERSSSNNPPLMRQAFRPVGSGSVDRRPRYSSDSARPKVKVRRARLTGG